MEVQEETLVEISEETCESRPLEDSTKEYSQEYDFEKNTHTESVAKESTTEAVTYKPRHLDTETLIKGEIKQLMFTEVLEATREKTLADLALGVEEQITVMKENRDRLSTTKKTLDREIEIDLEELKRREEYLVDSNEMIECLKGDFCSLAKRLKSCRVGEILDKSQTQVAKFESLKDANKTACAEQRGHFEKILSELSACNTALKLNLTRKEEMTENQRAQHNSGNTTNLLVKEEIDKYLNKTRTFKDKLNNLTKLTVNQEQNTEDSLLQTLNSTKNNHMEKLANMSRENTQLRESLAEIECSQVSADVQLENSQKDTLLNTLREQLDMAKRLHENTTQQLRQESVELKQRMEERQINTQSQLQASGEKHKTFEAHHVAYVMKSQEKLEMTNELSQKHTVVNHSKQGLMEKQIKNCSDLTKIEKLQEEYDRCLVLYKSLEDQLCQDRNNKISEETKLTEEYKVATSDHDKCLQEMRKRKEYILATGDYLREKSEQVHREVEQIGVLCKNLEEESASLKGILDKKDECLNKLREKLKMTKDESLSKSTLKQPLKESLLKKKVQFNDTLFFKSTTESSENSSQVVFDMKNQMAKSFTEWLEDL